jgi:hypothetical protein
MAASNSTLLSLAEQILDETYSLVKRMKQASIKEPSLEAGSNSDLWLSPITYLNDQRNELEEGKRTIYGLTKQLTNLLNGPHEFLHEHVSSNWDHGALYALLEFDVLEKIPLDGSVHVSDLAAQAGLPENKLLAILRLSACDGIVKQVSDRIFAHTAISEELLKDPTFKAFIGFQYVLQHIYLYEKPLTRSQIVRNARRQRSFCRRIEKVTERVLGRTYCLPLRVRVPLMTAIFYSYIASVGESPCTIGTLLMEKKPLGFVSLCRESHRVVR